MRNWSSYIPNLSSWINAFLLAGLLIIATSLIPAFYHLWTIITFIFAWIFYFVFFLFSFLINVLPQLVVFIITQFISFLSSVSIALIKLVSPLILLLPIPIIAFAHHYLYLLLDRYYPDFSPAERGRITGYFPGIASWWQGLYGLLVIILGMLVSDAILSILPGMNFNNLNFYFSKISGIEAFASIHTGNISFWVRIALMIFVRPIYSPFMRLVIWIITAAYLYQFEFKVKQHFIDSALRSSQGDR